MGSVFLYWSKRLCTLPLKYPCTQLRRKEHVSSATLSNYLGCLLVDNFVQPMSVIRFGLFEADLQSGELRKNGLKIRLQGQPFQVLAILLKRPGELVTREELRQQVWPQDTFVDFDHALNTAITKIRVALGDDSDNPRFVETVPRRGYRLIAVTNGSERPPIQEQPAIRAAESHPGRWLIHRLPIALGVVTLLVAVVGGARYISPNPTIPARKLMLVVLPFENLSHDSEQEYFSDGMTEEMIAQLGGLQPERLGVIARVSSMKYKNTSKTIGQIGKELGVDYVLETSVRRSGDRVRITAQLIEVRDQAHIWAQSYDRDLQDVLAVQADVAHGIAEEVQTKLPSPVTGHLAAKRVVDREAYEDNLKGRYFLAKWTQEDWQKGKDYLERAVAKDPTYAPAYAALSDFYLFYGGDPPLFDPRETFEMRVPKAEAAARKAIALDDSLVDGHLSLAGIYLYYYWDWAATEKEIRRGLQLNPSDAGGHSRYAEYLGLMGSQNESLAEYKRALELSPLDVGFQVGVGRALFFLGRYDESIDAFRRAVELDPNNPVPHGELTNVYEKKHMYKESIAEWQLSLKLGPSSGPDDALLLEHTYLASGFDKAKKTVWRKQLERAKESVKRGGSESVDLARLYAQLGDKERAFYWLEKCLGRRSYIIAMLTTEPAFGDLRSDPRFSVLLRKAGTPSNRN